MLNQIDVPYSALSCEDPFCESHHEAIDTYFNDLVKSCITAAQSSIPKGKSKRRAGWSEFVKPLKEKSIFWHKLWVANGRPSTGLIKQIMLQTRQDYKRKARWVIRNQDKLSSDRMAKALLENRSRDFWSEVKRVQSSNTMPCAMDNVQGDENVCELFKEKFNNLYNSVSYVQNDMDTFIEQLNAEITEKCLKNKCYASHNVVVDDIIKATKKLKSCKSDVNDELSSDHFINACQELYVHVTFLFNCMIRHAYAPHGMLASALVPIPKDKKKSATDSENYRSIAIESVLGKMLDNIILSKHCEVLMTNPLQFGFKAKHSTSQCTYLLQEVISYFTDHQSPVYCVLLDASKAFDRIEYIKLFTLLKDRGLCPTLCKMLAFMYTNQSLVVKWNGIASEEIECTNGVKQGGVLSPTLFCIYMDELLWRLEKSNVGCYIGQKFVGACCYADDLSLLAPSRQAMVHLIKVCESFASEYSVKFNAKKSALIRYNMPSGTELADITMNGTSIKTSDTHKHLGSIIGEKCNEANIQNAVNDLTYRTNILLSRYQHCSSFVLCELFHAYCSHYYGSSLWRLDQKSLEKLLTTWKKCVRRIFKLPYKARSKYLPMLVNRPTLNCQLLQRFLKFWRVCTAGDNSVLKYVSHISLSDSNSVVAENLKLLMYKMQCDYHFLESSSASVLNISLQSNMKLEVSESDECIVNAIRELIPLRDCISNSDLSSEEVKFLIDCLSCVRDTA